MLAPSGHPSPQEPLPETVLQFGGGRFLRAFADLFVHQGNQAGQALGRVVVLQSTPGDRARLLNEQRGRYHVLLRGTLAGRPVDETWEVASVSRALVAAQQWPEVLEVARSPHLRAVLSNTTEVGIALHDEDRLDDAPPRSFPAKLLQVLRARREAGLPPVAVLPCELIERNGERLRDLVLEQARRWGLSAALQEWARDACCWPSSLVDRIVVGPPREHPLFAQDRLLTLAEPYALWALEKRPGLPPLPSVGALRLVEDVRPYYLRKVRILNAAHSALVARALPLGHSTVRRALEDPKTSAWLRSLLFEEVVPVLEGRVEDPEGFAREVLERFANPHLEHRLEDIALHHEAKVAVRLVPTRDEYRRRFGKDPALLQEVIGP